MGEVSSSATRDLRLWLNTDDLQGPTSRDPADSPLTSWSDLSGSGALLAPDSLNGNPGSIIESFGVRRDSHLLQRDSSLYYRPFKRTDDAYLYLKLNEQEGNTAFDFYNSARNGTYVGEPFQGIKFFGSYGTQFDGIDDSINLPFNTALANLTQEFYVSAWIKPDKVSSDSGTLFQRIVSDSTLNNGWGLGLRNDKLLFTAYGVADLIFNGITPYSIPT